MPKTGFTGLLNPNYVFKFLMECASNICHEFYETLEG